MTDRIKTKRRRDVAMAKSRYDKKKRENGYTQSQIWLNESDRENARIIGDRDHLSSLSDIVSKALSVTVASGTDAQETVQNDQIDAPQTVQPLDK